MQPLRITNIFLARSFIGLVCLVAPVVAQAGTTPVDWKVKVHVTEVGSTLTKTGGEHEVYDAGGSLSTPRR